MKEKECYCRFCTHLDWIDCRVYGDLAWCKIESEEHREPRSVIDSSYCKDFKKSKRERF